MSQTHSAFRKMSMPRSACFILILLGMAVAALACKNEHDDAPPSSVVDKLQFVSIPAGIPEQMLDYEGFIVSFNPECHQPNWVAWELTRDEAQASDTHRGNAQFMPDDKVAGCASLDDYRRSGLTRGHMCPAGDMRWSQKAMDQCFLLTNMTPQTATLNNGAWKSLEDKSRYWAIRDSAIVIVCGPILSDQMPDSIGANRVPVPQRFFKVLLAPYANPPRAIGFIMPNGNVPGGMQAAAVSVDEVEAITGFDFFYELPDEIEDQVEAECNFPRWNRRYRP